MKVCIYIDRKYSMEENTFLINIIREFLQYNDKINIFIDSEACYELNSILKELFAFKEEKKTINPKIFVNMDEFKGLGLHNIQSMDEYGNYIKHDSGLYRRIDAKQGKSDEN